MFETKPTGKQMCNRLNFKTRNQKMFWFAVRKSDPYCKCAPTFSFTADAAPQF